MVPELGFENLPSISIDPKLIVMRGNPDRQFLVYEEHQHSVKDENENIENETEEGTVKKEE